MNTKNNPGLAATRNQGLERSFDIPKSNILPADCFNELQALLNRYAGAMGITADIAGMDDAELYGVYCHLSRLGGTPDAK